MMKTDINTLPVNTDISVILRESSDIAVNDYKIVIGNHEAVNTYAMSWEALNNNLQSVVNLKRYETFLIKAVRNYVRKFNYYDLEEALINEEISDEQFNDEMENNNDKYAITLRKMESPGDAQIIIDLVSKIGYDLKDFSLTEVSEMFSIKEDDLITKIKSIKTSY